MKINRFVALAWTSLLVVGAMGAISYRVLARGEAFHSLQAMLQTQDCSQDQVDTDNVDLQCGDQNAPDVKEATGEGESKDGIEAAPTAPR